MKNTLKNPSANRDPITGTPGAHPVGTGIGAAAGGAATGAAVGTAAGPVGIAIGMVAGAVVGGLVGKEIAEKVDPTVEESFWRENYSTRPYYETGLIYEDYQPAYRTGYENYSRFPGKTYEEVESELERDYETRRAQDDLEWRKARLAARDAWQRLQDRKVQKVS